MRPFSQRITHRALRFPVRVLTPTPAQPQTQPQAPQTQPQAPQAQPQTQPQAQQPILGINVAAELARFRPFQTYASMPIGLRRRVVEVARKLRLAQKDARTMSEDVFELMAIVDHLAWCVDENERQAQGQVFAVTK